MRVSSGAGSARGSERTRRLAWRGASALLAAIMAAAAGPSAAGAEGWPHYGGSLGGDRQAVPSSITLANVGDLSVAWTYRTGDATDGEDFDGNPSKFQATPILVGGRLVTSSTPPPPGSETKHPADGHDCAQKKAELAKDIRYGAWPSPRSTRSLGEPAEITANGWSGSPRSCRRSVPSAETTSRSGGSSHP